MRHPMILTVLAGALACDVVAPVVETAPEVSSEAAVAADTTVLVLAPGESARVGDLLVRFVAVAEDSRCPADVTCVWAGNGAVRIAVEVAGEAVIETLNTNPAVGPDALEVSEHVIRLVALDPAPSAGRPIPAGAYRVTLEVASL